ncbi:MAG: hypothetical protein HKN67_13480 [Saprospiraceae bacterium]|nr:hypothetical protein [Saprospiraceae bacterium]
MKERPTRALIFGMVVFSIGTFLFLFSRYQYQKAASENYRPMEEIEQSDETFLLQRRKEEIMENSFSTSIELGEEYEKQSLLGIASDKYFDAKSIYPTAIKPRMALSRIYYQWAMVEPSYCWIAQKEVLFAMKYVNMGQYPDEYSELLVMKAGLNRQCGTNKNYAFLEQFENEMIEENK